MDIHLIRLSAGRLKGVRIPYVKEKRFMAQTDSSDRQCRGRTWEGPTSTAWTWPFRVSRPRDFGTFTGLRTAHARTCIASAPEPKFDLEDGRAAGAWRVYHSRSLPRGQTWGLHSSYRKGTSAPGK